MYLHNYYQLCCQIGYLQRISKSLYSICCVCELANTKRSLGCPIAVLCIIGADQMHIIKSKAFYVCIMSDHESYFLQLLVLEGKRNGSPTTVTPACNLIISHHIQQRQNRASHYILSYLWMFKNSKMVSLGGR